MYHCHIIIAWDLTFSATKEDLAQPGWIYFALNLKIHLFFSLSLYQMGENRLLRWMLTVSAETTHLSLSSWKTFLNAHQWIMCQRATGGQSSWSNRRGLQQVFGQFWTILHNSGLADNWGSVSFTKHFTLHKFHTIHKLMDVLYKKEGNEAKM